MSTIDWQNKIETEVYDTKQRVTGIEVQLNSVSTQLGNLTSSINNIADKLSNQTRTPWGHLASWAGVVFAVVTYHNSLIIGPLTANDASLTSRVEEIATRLLDHETSAGHSVEIERAKNLETRLKTLEDKYHAWLHSKAYPPES